VVRLAATIAIEGSDPNTALLAVEQDGILLAIDGVSHSTVGT
jgi:hypothetical protein